MILQQRESSGQDLSDENLDSNTLLMKKSLSIPGKSKLMGSSMAGAVRASFIMSDNGNLERIIRKRKRKNTDQLKTLMREFERNPNWSKDTLLDVSRKTGLSEAQVYKWGWD